jgi:uncharacterized membrane protein YbhN (UPF0104 family)
MKRGSLKQIGVVVILIATVAFFVHYFANHPEVRHQLAQTSPTLIAGLLALYLGTILALTLITYATLRLCKLQLSASETFLVTAYTAVVNFFGPLQSGPAFRAVYLKKKHNLDLKNYAVASLFYFFFYGLFSSLFLLSALLKWWLAPLLLATVIIALLIRRHPAVAGRLINLDLRGWYYLALATFLQVSLIAAIYYAELHSVAPHTTLSQAIVYTGAANLALFVSITPAAIGFRESFLVFSQHLHHVSGSAIVAANLIDRAVYVLLLVILAVFIFGTHANRRLKVSRQETT